jgi:CRP-like cAMP-binding protein
LQNCLFFDKNNNISNYILYDVRFNNKTWKKLMSNGLQLNIVNFIKDAYIIIEGKASDDDFYIIKNGTVSIKREALNETENLKPGDFFGVISAMSNHNYIETAVSISDISLIKVFKDQFPLLIQKNNSVAMKIILSFSKKLRELDTQMAEITLKSVSTEDVVNLFSLGEYYFQQKQFNQSFYSLYKFLQYFPSHEKSAKAKELLTQVKPQAKAVFLTPESMKEFKRVYPDNTMIFCEHEPGNELYIIQAGKVKITKIINNKEVLLAVLKEGDIFGEMALLENKPRNASATAYGETTLMCVNKENFKNMISTQPQLVTKLISLLAERTWTVYRQLANLKIASKIGRTYDMLLVQLEKNRIPIKKGTAHSFEFGPKELITMVGLSDTEGKEIIHEIFTNKKFELLDSKIVAKDIEEIQKQVDYYKKMEILEQKRKNSKQTY